MNTANLQMEGVLLALAGLVDLLREKGLATGDELRQTLERAEAGIGDPPAGLSDSNAEAIRFPIRFLLRALDRGDAPLDFVSLAGEVGRSPRTGEASAETNNPAPAV